MRIGITGHRKLGDSVSVERIRAALGAFFRDHAHPGDEALSSLAVGADQLFARAALDQGLRLHAVVPCRGYEGTFSSGAEQQSFEALLAAAKEVTTLEHDAPSEAAFEAAGHWIVDHCDRMVAVWDGLPAKGRGGTGDIVEYGRNKRRPVLVVSVR